MLSLFTSSNESRDQNKTIDALTAQVINANALIETLTAKMKEMDDLIGKLIHKIDDNVVELDHRIDMSFNGDKWVSVKNTIRYTLDVAPGYINSIARGETPTGDDPSRVVGLTNLKMLSMSHNSNYSGLLNKISNKSVELLCLYNCIIPDLSKFPSLVAIHLQSSPQIQAPDIICQLQLYRHKVTLITCDSCDQTMLSIYCEANGIEFIPITENGVSVNQAWKKRFDWI